MPLCIDTMDRSPLHAYYKRRPARIARCTVTAISAVALGGIAIAVLVARAYDWHHYTFWALIIGAAPFSPANYDAPSQALSREKSYAPRGIADLRAC